MSEERRKLYAQAARCFQGAGLLDDACRCFEAGGDYTAAGRVQEQLQLHQPAARSYELGRAWRDAARCWLAADRPRDAGRCLEQGQQGLQAAWVFAEHAHSFDRARALARRLVPESPADQLAQALVLARCFAGKGDRRRGGALLSAQVAAFEDRTLRMESDQLFDWALAVADHLGRPDLTTALFTVAQRSGGYRNIAARWEEWTVKQMGSADWLSMLTDQSVAPEPLQGASAESESTRTADPASEPAGPTE